MSWSRFLASSNTGRTSLMPADVALSSLKAAPDACARRRASVVLPHLWHELTGKSASISRTRAQVRLRNGAPGYPRNNSARCASQTLGCASGICDAAVQLLALREGIGSESRSAAYIEARDARRAREAQLIFTKTRLQLTPEDPRIHKILYRRRRVAATGAVN